MMGRLNDRRGQGLVMPFVLGLLMVLGIGAMLILYNTGSNLRQASKDAGGLIVESLALSAIEEGIHRFQVAVNDPRHPLFRELRKALIEGNQVSVDLAACCDPEKLRRELAESEDAGFYRHVEIESFHGTLRVPPRAAALARMDEKALAEAPAPGEQFVDFDCAVRLDLQGRSVWRRVFMRRRYGITFISPYKPFDQFTFAIISSGFLENYPEVIDRTSRVMIASNQAGGFLAELLSRMATTLPGERIRLFPRLVPTGTPPPMPAEAAGIAGRRLAELRARQPGFEDRWAEMEPDEQGWFRWGLVEGDPSTMLDRPSAGPANVTLPDWPLLNLRALVRDLPVQDAVIFSTDDEVNLEDFDFDARLVREVEPDLEALDAAFAVYNRATARIMGKSERPLDAREVESYLASIESGMDGVRRSMPVVVKDLNQITRDVNARTTTGLTSEVFESYLNSASRRLRNLAYHMDTKEELDNLRKRLPVFNGHVNYNGLEPFRLQLDAWRGKTLFSAPWRDVSVPITIADVTTVDPKRDRVCLNYSECHFTGRRVQAAVFVQDRAFFDRNTTFEGNLILRRLRVRSERMEGEDLRGTVRWDPLVASGRLWKRRRVEKEEPFDEMPEDVSLSHYTVGLCPRFQQRAIFRTPDALEAGLKGGDES